MYGCQRIFHITVGFCSVPPRESCEMSERQRKSVLKKSVFCLCSIIKDS